MGKAAEAIVEQGNSASAELARSTNSDGGSVDEREAETSGVVTFERFV